MIKGNKFILYSNCVTVRGYQRALIYDLQFHRSILIPVDIFDLLNSSRDFLVTKKFNKFTKVWITFLEKKGYGFYCTNLQEFPPIDLSYHTSYDLLTVLIDYNNSSVYDLEMAIGKFEEVRCETLQIRIYDEISPGLLEKIAHLTSSYSFRLIEVLANKSTRFSVQLFQRLFEINSRFSNFTVYNSEKNEQLLLLKNIQIQYKKEKLINCNQCGKISRCNFRCNIFFFSEAKFRNTCLNQKISVDVDGNVKNCPAMETSYCKIENFNAKKIIGNKEFTDYWFIKKDDIETCMHCEYRYMCTDCRAFVKIHGNAYSKPSKCNYNPYRE